jgi:hypothetical protein
MGVQMGMLAALKNEFVLPSYFLAVGLFQTHCS